MCMFMCTLSIRFEMCGLALSSVAEPSSSFPYFLLDFVKRDKIHLIFANSQVVNTVSSSIRHMWMCGIEKERRLNNGCYEIRFFNTLFSNSSYHICCILMKRVLCKILMDLYETGWQPIVASSLSSNSKLSTWFFYKMRSRLRPKSIICLSLASTDRLQLINAPEALKQCLKETVKSAYTYGMIQEARYGDDYEIKLKGRPWNSCVFEENLAAKCVILEIVRNFSNLGYQIYNTANTTGSLGTLFFVARTPWQLRGVQYFILTFNHNDNLRVIGASEVVNDVIRETAETGWIGGIDRTVDFGTAVEHQLGNSPWALDTTKNVKESRTFICKLLETLSAHGWRVAACMCLSQRISERGAIIMRSCATHSVKHCAISLNKMDVLKLVKVDENDFRTVHNVLKKFGSLCKKENTVDSFSYKLKGTPWSEISGGKERLMARCMMCHVLKSMVDASWKLMASLDLCPRYSSGGAGDTSVNSFGLVHNWFFVKMDAQASKSEAVTDDHNKENEVGINL